MPDPEIRSSYTPTGIQTATRGVAPGGVGPGMGPLLELLARSMSKKKAAAAAPQPTMMMAAAPAQAPLGSTPEANEGMTPLDLRLKNAKQRAELLQLQALEGQAPKRLVYGPGITTGYVTDPMAMSAYQRQAFLPKEAHGQESIRDTREDDRRFAREMQDRADKRAEEHGKETARAADYERQEGRRRTTERRLGIGGGF